MVVMVGLGVVMVGREWGCGEGDFGGDRSRVCWGGGGGGAWNGGSDEGWDCRPGIWKDIVKELGSGSSRVSSPTVLCISEAAS